MSDDKPVDDSISLRNTIDADRDFLERLYIESRHAEFDEIGWAEAQIEAFLAMQFAMQSRAYEMQFPGARHSVIEFENAAVGRLIIYRNAEEMRLVDVSVLSEFRNRGIGGHVIRQLQTEAATASLPLVLRVLKTNQKAVAFYTRYEFVASDENPYWAMKWRKEN